MTRTTTIAAALLMALAVSVLGGCKDKVDGSSDAAFKESMEKMAEELSEEDKKKLGAAMMTVMFTEMAEVAKASKGKTSGEETNKILREKLDGMTADDIIALGEKLEKEGKGLQDAMGKMFQNAMKNATQGQKTPPMPTMPPAK